MQDIFQNFGAKDAYLKVHKEEVQEWDKKGYTDQSYPGRLSVSRLAETGLKEVNPRMGAWLFHRRWYYEMSHNTYDLMGQGSKHWYPASPVAVSFTTPTPPATAGGVPKKRRPAAIRHFRVDRDLALD